MSAGARFSVQRWWSIVLKEFLQLRRDRITFGMIVGLPIMQLLLFGFAIYSDPRHMPTAVIVAEHSDFSRTFVHALENTTYFRVVRTLPDEAAGREALLRGDVQFVVSIPTDFSRKLLRGERPVILVEADATDPSARISGRSPRSSLREKSVGMLTTNCTSPRSSASRPAASSGRVRTTRN